MMVPAAFATATNCGVPVPPNNTNGILPVYSNNNNVYCINNFGWSDTWLVNNPGGPLYDTASPNFDILSGDDAPWVQNVTAPGSSTGSWLSPTLDQGTLNPQTVSNSGVGGTGWQVGTALFYTPTALGACGSTTCQAESIIFDTDNGLQSGNGLEITITTTVHATGLTIDYNFSVLGNANYADLQMMDYFNAHPAGSTGPGRTCGTTSYAGGTITTVNSCGGPVVADAFMSGSLTPTQAETGVAADTYVTPGAPNVWKSVQTGSLNNLTPTVGPTDSAGALLWDLGAIGSGASRSGIDLTISKGFDINIGTPEPGTLVMGIGAGLLLLGLRRKRSV